MPRFYGRSGPHKGNQSVRNVRPGYFKGDSMENNSSEKTAMGLKESSKVHEKNISTAIKSASEDMQVRINESEPKNEIPHNGIVMTYSETIVSTGEELDLKRTKRKWIDQYSQKLPGEHTYNLKKHGRAIMVSPLPDGSELWQIFEVADIHPNEEAKKRLELNAKALSEAKEQSKT